MQQSIEKALEAARGRPNVDATTAALKMVEGNAAATRVHERASQLLGTSGAVASTLANASGAGSSASAAGGGDEEGANGIVIGGRRVVVLKAVDRVEAKARVGSGAALAKKKDARNLHLAKEGNIVRFVVVFVQSERETDCALAVAQHARRRRPQRTGSASARGSRSVMRVARLCAAS